MQINNNLVIAAVVAVAVVLAVGVGYVMSENGKDYGAMASGFVNDLNDGEYEKCWEQFDDTMKAAVPVESLKAGWESVTGIIGPMTGILKVDVTPGENTACEVIGIFGESYMKILVVYDQSDRIPELRMVKYYPENLPDGLMEEEVIVGEGTRWALDSRIVTSEDGVRSDVAAVLVQGSGPSDMDESVYANTPLRDLAWYLGMKDIDTIRYDKRTYVYGADIVDIKNFTVEEETIQDAILAGKILRDLGYKEIYLIGHSLGGMLAPRIVSESDGLFDGFVSLAGSPRTLTDIMVDQQQAAIDKIENSQTRMAYQTALDAEKLKIADLEGWTDEEAMEQTIFGVTAYYFKEMNEHDAASIAKSLDCPMLFLQGSADFQVDTVKDFGAWQTAMEGQDGVYFELFPGLNHMFMVSMDPGKGTVQEYYNPSHVVPDVIDAISSFIGKN